MLNRVSYAAKHHATQTIPDRDFTGQPQNRAVGMLAGGKLVTAGGTSLPGR
ncbi:MAG: hypothetical protein IPM39_10745 [Chloroflexi bacterium]|nr:hypothetical protein [Chloroflexota bacterium]